ncbi:lasso peptide biosynthesis B2 protein [Streptomyces niveus]|uniref:lasso peptide biosynthesis B2 protein n=1 Tax=Streptomyces niveus TaxID=193462 RepID=UPI002E35A640|nr:lasso peptide biosynthesis B2 protein [Streptomyces niveus]WTA63833.1 lasso peptide biosynthesis B2 protein [Streptomyces niveus]
MAAFHIPEHVHESRGPRGGTVLLDARTGQWYAMNGTARALWSEWRESGDFDAGVRTVAAGFPPALGERVRTDAGQLAELLLQRGLVSTAPSSDGSEPSPRRRPERRAGRRFSSAPRHDRSGATAALVVALCLLRLPFGVTVRMVAALTSRCPRPATYAQAEQALAAVRRGARRYPGRVACLELSLAATVRLALAGLGAQWCLGSADDPYRFHAWIEAGGRPVTSPSDGELTGFRKVLSV